MAAVTQERPHLGVTIFSSSNTSAEIYFEREARPVCTACLLLPSSCTCATLCFMDGTFLLATERSYR